MKNEKHRIPTSFGPDTLFELPATPLLPYRDVQETRFERLKARLLRERLDGTWEPEFNAWLRRAANEASALAWTTAYPLLVFPALFEEKVREATHRVRRQRSVYQRSHELLLAV